MNVIQSLLTGQLDIWTTAETEKKSGRGRTSGNGTSVYGIQKLRELILELAVRGKLVPQDPNDEPASELLKRIQAEKTKLIAEGKIKKDKPLPQISDEEKPFELPQGWEWVRLGEIFSLEYGDNLPSDKRSNSGKYPVYGSNGIVGSHDIAFVNSPCIVIGRKGSAGALNLSLSKGCCVTDVAYYCMPPKCIDIVFSFKLFHTLGLDSLGKGIKPGLNRNEVYELLIAVPPIEEQHRIVAKVDELMALCDQLETQHINAAEAHEKLVSHLLGTLTQSQNADDFSANWQCIAAHFDTLFTTEASIDALKQTLLQLAVMGKLVPQDPNDEPASELLKRIQAEKAKLVAEGKIKKDKPLPPISEEEEPFELPQGWEWVRLDELANLITKGSSPKWQGVSYTDNREDVMFITSENVGSYALLLNAPKYVEKKFNEIEPRSILARGDFLMNIVGASIGRTAIYNFDALANINQAVCLIRISTLNLLSAFLLHFFNSETCLGYMFDKQVDNARPNLSMGNIAKFLIPIPPPRRATPHRS